MGDAPYAGLRHRHTVGAAGRAPGEPLDLAGDLRATARALRPASRGSHRQPAVPHLLRQWRQDCGVTLGALALKSGVSKGTLSRWEAGLRTPCPFELSRVLDALSVPPAERLRVWAMLGHADAARREAEAAQVTVRCYGDVLRAARRRLGWTQRQVADCLGVRQGTVSKWEHSADRPCPAIAATLCDLLGVVGAERAQVLHGGIVALAPPPL